MTRVLFVGDLAATGFGSVTTDLGRALLDRGLDVRFLSQNDLRGALPEPFLSRTADLAFYEYQAQSAGVTGIRSLLGDIVDGIPGHRLANGDPFGDWRPDAILLLGDFVAARLLWHRFREPLSKVPTYHYVPIEGVDLPPLWGELWRWVRPVAMSVFGQDEIAKVTGVRPPLAYHGVDEETFFPVGGGRELLVPRTPDETGEVVAIRTKDAAKRFFGFDPGHTIALRTDRLMPRKRYPSLLRSMAPLLEERDDFRLVLHCAAFDQGGFLPDEISKLSPVAQSRIVVTDRPGLPRPVLAALYNAADVYLSTSAEGFGLTIAEAIACGVPAVGLRYSAVPEVIGPAGTTVEVGCLYDNEYNHRWAAPDEVAYTEAVRYLLDRPARRRELGALGPRHVRDHFRWSEAARIFSELFAEHPFTA